MLLGNRLFSFPGKCRWQIFAADRLKSDHFGKFTSRHSFTSGWIVAEFGRNRKSGRAGTSVRICRIDHRGMLPSEIGGEFNDFVEALHALHPDTRPVRDTLPIETTTGTMAVREIL